MKIFIIFLIITFNYASCTYESGWSVACGEQNFVADPQDSICCYDKVDNPNYVGFGKFSGSDVNITSKKLHPKVFR